MIKIIILAFISLFLTSCQGTSALSTPSPAPEPTETESISYTKEQINPEAVFVADKLSLVKTVDCSLLSSSSMDTVNLYTSSEKENGKFLWDDHARWLLEVYAETGEHYILYDLEVSNGSIYFDVLEIDEKPYIFIRNISTASDYTKVFSFEDGKVFETKEINLNEMTDKVINLIYTSVPNYR